MLAESYDIRRFAHDTLGALDTPGKWRLVWGHGWGQNRHAMAGLAQSLTSLGGHILLDFPGFGDAPPPDAAWSTADYADLAARFLASQPHDGPTVWIGHSFGGRVGIQLAARHPASVDRLILIAAAGLQRKRSLADQVRVTGKVYTFKALKRMAPVLGMDVDKLRERLGSADYRNAGAMRDILSKVVREDLSAVAAAITCPTRLIYGENDTETPPEIGERLASLIPDAHLSVLPGQDHYSLLGEGRHQVARRIRDFLETEAPPA
jgi:pimeloyl-ACP methyl ester carboxylesterase